MRGFKDDFYAWKDSLSKDEQALLLKQAQNEFDKKFRKSDEFSQDLPEEKIQSFAKVLKKFFDNAARPACSSLEFVCTRAPKRVPAATCAHSFCFSRRFGPRKRMTTRRRPGKWGGFFTGSVHLFLLSTVAGRRDEFS